MLDAEELHRRAQEAHRAGRHQAARGLLVRARGRTDDPDLSGRIELTLAYVDAETGDPAGGLERCLAALEMVGITSTTKGLIWSQLALLRMRRGEKVRALDDFDRAIALLEGEPEHLGRAYLNRGGLHLQGTETASAIDDFSRAVEQFERAGLVGATAKTQHNLGYARLLNGDLVSALRQMEDAALVLAPLSPVSQAMCDQDRAEVLVAAGRPHEAAQALRSAATAYGVQRLRRFQAECELVLARTLMVDDPAASRTVARRAARRFKAHDSPVWATRADAVAVIADISSGRRAARLLDDADRLTAELKVQGHALEADQIALYAARLAVRRGDLADAADRLARVRTAQDAPVTMRLLAHEVRAELAAARGQSTRARRQARDGLSELHDWQSTFGSLDLQSTLVAHGQDLARLGLDLAVRDASPRVVLEWSERARALASRVTPVRPPHDPEVAADLAALRALGDSDADNRRARELRERIRQHSWYAAGGGKVGEPTGMDELVAGLAATDAALVAYLVLGARVLGARVHALVVSDAGARLIDLGDGTGLGDRLDVITADLDMAASRDRGPMAAVIQASLTHRLDALAAELVAPVLPVIGDRRVVLTPSGSLAGTPWSLLDGFRGRPLTVAPSATRWLALRAGPTPARRVGLVAGPHVDRAEEEVTRAAGSWPSAELLTGAEATTTRVAELAARVDVLHLAGHGRHSGENPLFSAVELADGPWFGHDIDNLARTPTTVVLSACELGRVSVRSGEETVGMSAAWLYAGARNVVSSPALVADALACEALARWHSLVAAGAAPADALAQVGTQVPPGQPLPFVCFGAGW